MSPNDSPAAHYSSPTSHTYDQVLLLGDSLFQQSFSQDRGFAFGAALANAYVRKRDVVNRGFSGYNTSNLLSILPHLPLPEPESKCGRIRLILLLIGSNDAVLPSSPTNQHVPLHVYTRNLRRILTHPTLLRHSPRVLLITPPPIDEHLLLASDIANGHGSLTREAVVTKTYAEAAAEVGRDLGGSGTPELGGRVDVRVLHLWEEIMVRRLGWKEGEPLIGTLDGPRCEELEELLYDGLHLSPVGYRVLFDAVMMSLREEWNGEEHPDNLPTAFPLWRDMPGMEGAVDF